MGKQTRMAASRGFGEVERSSIMADDDRYEVFRALNRCLHTPDGQTLLEALEHRFGEQRTIVIQKTLGGDVQYLGRMSSYRGGQNEPYETLVNEGSRKVLLFLKDMYDWVEE